MQRKDDDLIPIEFFSRILSPAGKNYAVHKEELLTIVSALDHFEHRLINKEVTRKTDHKPLIHLHSQKYLSERQFRWIFKLSRFSRLRAEYIKGIDNCIADLLSRPVTSKRKIEAEGEANAEI